MWYRVVSVTVRLAVLIGVYDQYWGVRDYVWACQSLGICEVCRHIVYTMQLLSNDDLGWYTMGCMVRWDVIQHTDISWSGSAVQGPGVFLCVPLAHWMSQKRSAFDGTLCYMHFETGPAWGRLSASNSKYRSECSSQSKLMRFERLHNVRTY